MTVRVSVRLDLRGLEAFSAQIAQGLDRAGPGPFADMRTQWARRYLAFATRRFIANGRGGGDGSWPPLALSTIRARLRRHTQQRGDVKKISKEIRELKKQGAPARQIGALERQKRNLQGLGAGTTPTGARSSLARDTSDKRFWNDNPSLRGRIVGAQPALGLDDNVAVTILQDTGTLLRALQIGAAGNRVTSIPGGIQIGFTDAPHPGKGSPTIAQIAAFHQNGGKHLPRRTILVQPDAETTKGMAADMARAIDRALAAARGSSSGEAPR